MARRESLTLKRLFDLVTASIGLCLLAPLLIGIALWIKLDSPGPVFFRQLRIGQYGRPFHIFKFRTMRTGSEAVGRLTIGEDRRITRAGHLLRRYKLDELPQLIDVVRGRMSLVGPRPEVPEYVAHYPAALHDLVLSVRPGITDYASLEMLDESKILARHEDPHRAYIEEILPHKLNRYAEYVRRQSVREDIRIIGRTLYRILRQAVPAD
ncbi:hypothetical protein CKO15_01025 [Halorhodospira abdelmalekii]|uniref:sugar transferase n=1 Tax=Halorhodospira abdelmalekii TaxID=421629 RepID=UPI001903A967|nr:sugar transferase [Halorhodospira abdelmalekii]MBK1733883.1 hypothetical protein [Halorhodospira abdelmalekii]